MGAFHSLMDTYCLESLLLNSQDLYVQLAFDMHECARLRWGASQMLYAERVSTGYCYGIDIDKTMMMHSRFWSVKCPSVWKTSRASRPKFWVRRSPRFCCRLHGAITLTPRISYGLTQVPTRPHHQTSQFTSHLFCRVPVSSPV